MKKHYPKYIIEKLKEDTGLSSKELEDVLDSQFKFVSNLIEKGNTRGVKLMKFGHFIPKPRKIDELKERVLKRKDDKRRKEV